MTYINEKTAFVTIGDGGLEATRHQLQSIAKGALKEVILAVPFSDPCSDTVDEELAAQRALQTGLTFEDALDVMREFHATNPDIAIVARIYVNMICARGLELTLKELAEAGVKGLIVPDLPQVMRELEPQWNAIAHDCGLVFEC